MHSFIHPYISPEQGINEVLLESDRVPFVPAGDGRHAGVPAVAQGAEPLLLQAADEPRPFSLLLPGLLARDTRARPHVPLWCPLVRSCQETTVFLYVRLAQKCPQLSQERKRWIHTDDDTEKMELNNMDEM